MFDFLDILPLIFYMIAGIIAISYQIYFGNYAKSTTKKINTIFITLVILFEILSIASTVVFWLLY